VHSTAEAEVPAGVDPSAVETVMTAVSASPRSSAVSISEPERYTTLT